MKIFVPYSEIQEIIHSSANQIVKFSHTGKENTVNVKYTIGINVPVVGKISKDVDIDITFNSINGVELDLVYSLNSYLDIVAKAIKTFLGEYIEKTEMIKWGNQNNNQIILLLDKILYKCGIEDVDRIFSLLEVNTINALENGFEIEFRVTL